MKIDVNAVTGSDALIEMGNVYYRKTSSLSPLFEFPACYNLPNHNLMQEQSLRRSSIASCIYCFFRTATFQSFFVII